jgi:DNA mismatch repair protein MutL
LDAYDQLIPKNRYPVAIIYIEVDPILIDVNIHPRKQEIKFSEKDRLVNLIKRALKERLEVTHIYQKPKDDFSQTKISFYEDSPTFQESLELEIKEEESKEEKVIIPDMEYIGQYSGTYLLWQNEEALFLIDQHAAAERIRYEKYLKKWTESNQEIQELLTPLKVELANDILIKTHEHLKEISVLGVDLEIKDNYVLVKKIPLWFPKDYEELYVETIIQNLINDELVSQESMIDDLAKLLACKHSLKANHYISSLEANQLLNDLRKCKRPYTCPHGRPIIVDISLKKIEFWFNRVI